MAISDEEFLNICKKKFRFGDFFDVHLEKNAHETPEVLQEKNSHFEEYLDVCATYWTKEINDIANFNTKTGEKIDIPDESVKNFFWMLKNIAKTETGEKLLRELVDLVKVTLFVDERKKDRVLGYSTSNHLVGITYLNSEINRYVNAATLVHELTHEIQKQQGLSNEWLSDKQDKFMINKMMEAEARLNEAKFSYEIYYMIGGDKELHFFEKNMRPQLLNDVEKYKKLKDKKLPEEEINRQMLKMIYSDKNWSDAYNPQGFNAVHYETSIALYLQSLASELDEEGKEFFSNPDNLAEAAKISYMKRLGLNDDDREFFFNPDNLVNRSYKRWENTHALDEINRIAETVYELGVVAKRTYYDKQTRQKTEEERVVEGGKEFIIYDKNEKVFATIFEHNADDKNYTEIKREGYPQYTVERDKFSCGKILSVKDENGNIVADAEELNKQENFLYKIFGNLNKCLAVDDDELKKACQTLKEDKYGLYMKGFDAMYLSIFKEAKNRGFYNRVGNNPHSVGQEHHKRLGFISPQVTDWVMKKINVR